MARASRWMWPLFDESPFASPSGDVSDTRTPAPGGGSRREEGNMKIRTSVVASLGLALALSACGSTADTSPSGSGSGGSSSGSAPVDLTWRTRPDNQAEADVYNKIANEITAKNVGLKVTYQAGTTEGSGYQDKLKTELGAGTAPDVFWIPGADIADFAKSGLLLNFASQAQAQGLNPADFYSGPIDQLQVDPSTGQKSDTFLWGIPRDVSTFALYLNLDLIDKAGAENPIDLAKKGQWTWQKFAEVAQKITKNGGSGVKGFGANGWWANYGYFINAAGGSFFKDNRTACNLDSTQSVNGMKFFKGLYDSGAAVKFGDDAEPPFKGGKVGMFMNGRWATPGSRDIKDFSWDVAPLPTGPAPGGNWQFWGAYVINAKTANPDAAVKLVKELTSAEIQNEIASLGANIPSRNDPALVAKFLTYTPPANNQAFIDGIQNNAVAEGPLWQGNWPAFDKASNDSITKLMNGKITIDQYQKTVCQAVDAAGAFKN
jgi:multiple sugar transport system substrate-binding protein